MIRNYRRRNPTIGVTELWHKLKKKGYTRRVESLYRVLKKLGLLPYKPYQKPKSKMAPGGVPIIIPKFTAHWLRHTFITMMYMAGVDVLTAAKQAGHADIKVTTRGSGVRIPSGVP